MARVKMLVFAVSVFALTVMNFELPYLPADRLHPRIGCTPNFQLVFMEKNY